MTSLDDTLNAIKEFVEESSQFTNLYGEGDVGKVLYSALLLKERDDGLVGFGPRDIWNTTNEELMGLIKKLGEDVRVQAHNK
tara:strand:+ start:18274 stop:18519 length:246 start_codon:yes stop_codon:yes gene_type:complete